MINATSVSGGQTSAYVAANYPSDHLVFALVRIEDEQCRFKDEKIRREVEHRIQAPFIATAEDDMIIYTILDLEQYLGKKIDWVTGDTYDSVIVNRGGYLPNKISRFCTTEMKMKPIFNWWQKTINKPFEMQIGYRSTEQKRANKMLKKCDADGLLRFKAVVGKSANGRNKWGEVPWQKPKFPLIEDGINKAQIVEFWRDKPVRFAKYNNCVGCFHRNPVFLRFMFDEHPNKMNWFAAQEGGKKGYWRSENGEVQPYERIRKMMPQMQFSYDDFTGCDAGYCGL